MLEEVSFSCYIYNGFKRADLIQAVSFSLATDFNETVAMNLKDIRDSSLTRQINTLKPP